jgi:dTDP-4-dehydrorhamnose reductase
MKKVIITGSNGLLGHSLLQLLLKEKTKYQVFGFSRGGNRSGRKDFTYCEIDVMEKR